ncbi:MAG: DUF2267 domain-containing protein [Armatimonadota bacterium]
MDYPRLQPFASTLQKADQWMKDVMEELGPDDPQKAYHSLRAVLHALRDRLMPGEVTDLSSEMPMLIRGLFLEGWKATEPSGALDSQEEFFEVVNEELQVPADVGPEDSVRAIFRVLEKHVSCGEIGDVKGMLPEALQPLWSEECE